MLCRNEQLQAALLPLQESSAVTREHSYTQDSVSVDLSFKETHLREPQKETLFHHVQFSRYSSEFTITWPHPVDRTDFSVPKLREILSVIPLQCDTAPLCLTSDCDNFFACLSLSDFKSNFRAAPIRSVDVYNVMCNVAGIAPLPNNGSWSRVVCMLKGRAGSALSAPPRGCALAFILLLLFH